MYALIVGRSFPQKKTGMMGIFEFEQASALSKYLDKVVYSFCDTRGIRRLKKVGYFRNNINNVNVCGYHFPIGGINYKLYNKIKYHLFKKKINKIIIKDGIPDIIHIHFPLITINEDIWTFIKSLKRPLIVTEHWSRVQIKQFLRLNHHDLLKKVVNESDAFICVGEQLKKSVVELTNPDKEILVIPNMVNPMFYYKEKVKVDDTFNFFTIGRLEVQKRNDLVIDAFSRAFADNKNVYLHIVGGGPEEEILRKQIQDIKMDDRIIMHGYLTREKTADFIRNSDAFVSASVLETFGVPFIEAMACGKPVIGIKGGPLEKYINESNGILFKSNDTSDLVNALLKVYDNKNNYNEIEIAQKTYEVFSEKSVVKKIIEVYNKKLS